ncbi:MAG TPA: hydrogenase maturation protease [Chloroflexi bacterium]|nr:hydrogenase maturation protease [Chloroflexota bacterium]
MKTLVIGLGNPILTDDGVGVYVAWAVRNALPPEADVDVIELSLGGLSLMEAMVGYERVILVDALLAPPEEAGQVVQFNAGHLPATLNSASAHDVDLPTALQVGRRLGASLPDDENIQIVAIKAHEVLTFGGSPTPPVRAAIPEATVRVLGLLGVLLDPAGGDESVPSRPTVNGGSDGLS